MEEKKEPQCSMTPLSSASTLSLSSAPSSTTLSSSDHALYPYEEAAAARTLVDIFAASSKTYPTAPALDNGSDRLTYAELTAAVDTLVSRLREAGLGPGDRVGIRVTSGTTELYIGILAILKAGAAYVPVDVDDPDERADLVFSEAGVCAVITDNDTITIQDTKPIGTTASQKYPSPDNDAWIIFTSGSTGKPKGVAVTHRSAAAFVDAESHLFLPDKPLAPGDRVLAGLSVAFDASCEEMWLAWRHGACLVPAARTLVKAGAELGTFLTTQNISVVSTVPTLAALWPTESLSGLRLLILGGEACSPELAHRLAGAVGAVWNTYGPTEATVVSCGAPLKVGDPVVRIGLPLAGWRLAVVDADGHPVRWGEEGELVIGGVGMARYLDAEKDRAKFTPSPAFGGERAYRSGDLVRAEKEGLLFVGRNDEQIKLGGRRIELGEIDAAMMTLPGVKGAASAIRRTDTGNQVLVGYVVRDDSNKEASSPSDRNFLKRMLPPTLIPMLVTVDSIPVRTSGKVDRKALPWPPPASSPSDGAAADGDSNTMAWVSSQWRAVLGASGASPDANFFELGGTSLAAAQLVSQLRGRSHTLSVADVYEHPTLAAMADRVDELLGADIVQREVRLSPRWVIFLQSVVLVALFLLEGLRLMVPLFTSKRIFEAVFPDRGAFWATRHQLPWAVVGVLWALFMTMPGRLLTTVVIVRALAFGIGPGEYRRAGLTHLRLWAADRFVGLGRLGAIAGTNWARYYARLMGCRVGRDVQLHALVPVTGLAIFGDGAAIEPEVDCAGYWIDGDVVHVGTVTVGEGACVGARSILMPNAVVEPYATVEPGISVQGVVKSPLPPSASSSDQGSSHDDTFRPTSGGFRIGIAYTLALLMLDLLPVLMFAPIWGLMPILVKDYTDFRQLSIGIIAMTAPGTAVGLVLYLAAVVIIVRLANLAIHPGSHSWNGVAAFAAWLVHYLMMDVRTNIFPLFASLLTPHWLRLLGAKIGRNVEASTVVPLPSLLTVHDDAFLADDVLVAPYELSGGRMHLGAVSIGRRSFLGNSAIVDPDVSVPDNSLIGVLGSAPSRLGGKQQMHAGSSWLGRPPISLPRKVDANIDNALTFAPPMRLVVARALIESCRVLPLLLNGFLPSTASLGTLWLTDLFGFGFGVLAAAGLLVGCGLAAAGFTVAAKWLLTPNVRAGSTHPLWSSFVWRNELADSFLQAMCVPLAVRYIYGTPVLAALLRALGARVGRGAWIESHLLPEADLCVVGDGATVNRGSLLQTHLFHDRLMRLDEVRLGRGATLGPLTAALPGTEIGAGTTIAPLSLVMRGEHLPGSTRWRGNPVRPWRESDEEKMGKASRTSSWDSPSPV
ncbi:non-ribosomal peptide synthetase [Cordyceps fumosorosea ARSEF 2679]|uniref:Non-ribosomal peptide synthetase n=1 Tax=Cordyceps fumosorosea (strain ARSEF 2679) TaxID=1081104 RepID=A0A167RKM7_CORFA|nr:non-ribosomal peptide synthetase [Cordyceps fumosorosea ARSEF 2679]OAA58688.1 non-ribosomal peptide synthetase [Cordyceps fumosorosea ARSEF 2679]